MKENPNVKRTKFVYPVRYKGSLIVLIVFLILWLPLGIILLMKNGSFLKKDSIFYIQYHGSYFWLIFWSILFFPIAIALLVVNGADLVEETQASTIHNLP